MQFLIIALILDAIAIGIAVLAFRAHVNRRLAELGATAGNKPFPTVAWPGARSSLFNARPPALPHFRSPEIDQEARAGHLHFFPHDPDIKGCESVAITIDDDCVWVDVDGENRFRAKRVGLIQVDDRRVANVQ